MDGEEKTIDGVTFKVLMLDPLVANDLLVDLAKSLGPALGSIGSSVLQAEDSGNAIKALLDGSVEDNALIGAGLEKGIISLIDRIEKHKMREIISTMMEVTTVQQADKWPRLGTVAPILFRGRLKLMYGWLAFAVRAQFKDFF